MFDVKEARPGSARGPLIAYSISFGSFDRRGPVRFELYQHRTLSEISRPVYNLSFVWKRH